MKKRIMIGMIGLSLASGLMVFGKSGAEQQKEVLEICSSDCCEEGAKDGDPPCCQPTEMCCE